MAFSGSFVVYYIMWKNMIEPDDNIMMRRKDGIFMHNDEEKKADTHSMVFNTYCLSTAIVCIRTRLNVILYGFYQLERSMIFKFGRPST